MKVREPLYWGRKASKRKAYYLEQLARWEETEAEATAESKEKTAGLADFYVIKNPANPHNLMDIIKLSQWHQTALWRGTITGDSEVIGIAANGLEAEEVAVCIMEACYQQYGILDGNHIFPKEQVQSCTLS